jgi:hypothetical protein
MFTAEAIEVISFHNIISDSRPPARPGGATEKKVPYVMQVCSEKFYFVKMAKLILIRQPHLADFCIERAMQCR